jgi:K+-transporting ATPase KdpF subunit
VIVTWIHLVAGVLSVALMIYLGVALLAPEKLE